MIPFTPFWGISGGVAQTILGSQLSGKTVLPERISHKILLPDKNQLLCFEIPAEDAKRPMVVLIHGMGGCSESAYMKRITRKLNAEGFGVFMVNLSGSGPGMGLSNRLWNGGSSGDLADLVIYLSRTFPKTPILLAGFSLSGNVLLKYLGEKRTVPKNVQGALAVNPPIDLKAASLAISTGPWARTFNRYYMGLINQQMGAIRECFPNAVVPEGEPTTIYDFDVAYTAPAFGYSDVDEYYRLSSAAQFLENILVPTAILCSQDDPFVPYSIFDGLRKSLCVVGMHPEKGGHMGYLSRHKLPNGDHRWMDYFVVEWALNQTEDPEQG